MNEYIYGYIYKIISFDFDRGSAEFNFQILQSNSEVKNKAINGLIKCTGNIRYYAEGTPVRIVTDYFDDTLNVLYFNDISVIDFSDNILKRMFICHVIPNLANNKLLKLLTNDICNKQVLADNLSLADTELLYKKILLYKYKEFLFKKLISYNFTYDEILKILSSDFQINKGNVYDIVSITANINAIDQLAINEFGYDEYNIKRLYAFFYIAINDFISLGHSCVPEDRIIPLLERQFHLNGVYKTKITSDIINLLIEYSDNYYSIHTINSINYIYITKIYDYEKSIQKDIKRLSVKKKYLNVGYNYAEKENHITYNIKQRSAFDLLNTSGIKILTGPPGSGKTALIKGLLKVFIKSNPNKTVKLAATTGRAAKVLTAMSLDSNLNISDAVTVHKLLEITPFNNELLSKNINNPIDADLIIVDEVSMMGTFLFYKLLNAIKAGSILLLVGDEDQLESVDYGNVLHDLIISGVIDVYRLTEVLRQSGTICNNALRIKNNDYNLILDKSFVDIMGSEDSIIKNLVVNTNNNNDIQILSPIKNGKLGTLNINDICIDSSEETLYCYKKKVFRKNDKVIMCRTNYEIGYVNGDIGYIKGFADNMFFINFDGKMINIPMDCISDIEHAGAITIHKSQGSEFNEIHIVLPQKASSMISKKLLYTAITRAKQKVYLYHDTDLTELLHVEERQRISNLSKIISL